MAANTILSSNVRIVYAEDKTQLRHVVIEELERLGITCIGEASNGRELLRLNNLLAADAVLLDLDMPIMDGSQAMNLLLEKIPDCKIIVISTHANNLLIENYLGRGARGYVSKDAMSDDIKILARAIEIVKAGGIFVSEKQNGDEKIFSQRQAQMIPLICNEYTNRQIASELGITVRSVEKQRQKIYAKTGTTGSVSFLKYAFRKGLDFLGGFKK